MLLSPLHILEQNMHLVVFVEMDAGVNVCKGLFNTVCSFYVNTIIVVL